MKKSQRLPKNLLKKSTIATAVTLSSVWSLGLIYFSRPFGNGLDFALMGVWGAGSFFTVRNAFRHDNSIANIAIYGMAFGVSLYTFFGLTASNDRNWNKEVAHNVTYDRHGDTITVYHVRNFEWHDKDDYTERWETRQYQLSKLKSVDLVASYWFARPIAHTFVTFGFDDGRYLAFSIEIRKELGEEFSTFGGFFRQFELSIIASDEKDVIYTRSHIRGEDVYIYPVTYDQQKMQALFLAYLDNGKALTEQPQWYNSLTTNCTTAIFDMVKQFDDVPMDYRIILSGYLPEYLYDHHAIDHRYTMSQWHQRALINSKISDNDKNLTSAQFSQLIRQDF